MNTYGILLIGLAIGGLLYFWQKARLHGLNLPLIIIAFLFWPIGATIGLYWATKDLYFHYIKK